MSGVWRSIDWDLYHDSGPYTGPNIDLTAEVSGSISLLSLDPPLIDLELTKVDAVLSQAYDGTHMTGFDWATPLGGATIRGEAAFSLDRPFLRSSDDLVRDTLANLAPQLGRISDELLTTGRASVPLGDLSPKFDSVEWGVGVDYFWRGFFPLFQLNQIVILGAAPRLLVADPETRLTALLRKTCCRERLELEFRAVYEISRGSWFAFPPVSYLLRESLRARIGYLAIGGSQDSLIGQYRRNDEVVLQIRYTF